MTKPSPGAGHCPSSSVLLLPGPDLISPDHDDLSQEVAGLLCKCFPILSGLSTRSILEDSIGFHDFSETTWLLLLERSSQPAEGFNPIGLAVTIPYHDGMYVCNLCVAPEYRRKGIGLDLLEEAAHYAVTDRKLHALLGNADVESTDVVSYYTRLGAEVVVTGVGSVGGRLTSQVRLRRTVGTTEEEVGALFRSLREERGRRRRRQERIRMFAVGVGVVAAVAVGVLLTGRLDRRRRILR